MFDSILIPVDGTDTMDELIKRGYELAQTHDADVHGLFVNNVSDIIPTTTAPAAPREIDEEVERQGERTLDQMRRLSPPGFDPITEFRQGNPANEIIRYTDENDIDCIVIGRKGTSILSHLGSNTSGVVQGSNVPVLVVPFGDSDAESEEA
ncbi:universal stress protein [Natrinema gelatinilyticum]|uniref:universal stress protein n=1 Tax=Natrinema gelatinilyticum TaxID=2961571 RepID=UPI0020C4C32D|nr:universal stress protein [Natrinema gelatinilyticum]